MSDNSGSPKNYLSVSSPFLKPSTPVRQPAMSPALQGIKAAKKTLFPVKTSSNSSNNSNINNNSDEKTQNENQKFNLDAKIYGYDVHAFEHKLRRLKNYGSSAVASDTSRLLRLVIHKGRFNTWGELLISIQYIGEILVRARPLELVIGNIVKRLLFIIRREHKYLNNMVNVDDNVMIAPSILDIFHARQVKDYSSSVFINKYKTSIITELNELIDEISSVYQSICEYSVEHIHSNELILTYGSSRTVYNFFKHAAKYRSFSVFVCESAPSLNGQSMAYDLIKKINGKIKSVTLISDSSIFAIMSRVNKVIIGTHAILANGGLLTHSGIHTLALAAKFHSVPIVVVTGLYKLSTLYSYDQDTFNEHDQPSKLINYQEQSQLSQNVLIQNPVFDYVPPELVNVFITNGGGHAPSYMYRLLSEYYDTTEDRL